MPNENKYNNSIVSPLSGWISRKHPIPERFYNEKCDDVPDIENWATWVSLEETSLLHCVNEMNWISLKKSIEKTNIYLSKASQIINGLEGGWLDREEQMMILEQIGEPPIPCLPIYIITCADKKGEEIVYIGKTKCGNRFDGGHAAALKLHSSKFKAKKKKIYRCSIWFHFNNEYNVLEWIHPQELALEILDSIESKLIYTFKPELNINKKNRNYTKWDFPIHIQNNINHGFLNDTFI